MRVFLEIIEKKTENKFNKFQNLFFLHKKVCVQAISQTECIASLKKCMENNKDLQATTCETLSRLFKCQHVNFSHHLNLN